MIIAEGLEKNKSMKFWMKESIDYSNDLCNPHRGTQRVKISEYIGNLTAKIILGQQSSIQLN